MDDAPAGRRRFVVACHDRITGVACRVRGLYGWRAWALSCLLGLLSILAMAPFFAAWVLLVTIPGLIWLIDGAASEPNVPRRLWRAAGAGWWFGFGYHAAGLFWIGEAFLVEAEVFAWLLPFAVTLMPAGLALFTAAASVSAIWFWQAGSARVWVFALSLAAFEWLLGHVFTGFPWNVLGYALTEPLVLMQSASVLGIYGLTILTVVVAALPAVCFADRDVVGWRGGHGLLAAGAVVLAMVIFGALRLSSPPLAPVEGVRIRIVQPSIPQRDKWRPERQREFFLKHLDLTMTAPDGRVDGLAGVTHVVWPEAAMPFQPLLSPEALAAISQRLGEGRWLMSGALRSSVLPDGKRRAFNSLMVFGADGLHANYDKIHLVPFGEYLPFQSILEWIGLEQLTRVRGGFSIGVTPRPLIAIPGLPPVGPLICYEAIFPAVVVQSSERPGVLVNVTNDGWFGRTTGPQQHFHQARLRAVEEGIPLIRAANNGVSGLIDPYGRILAKLELDVVGTSYIALPSPLRLPIYARLGDIVFLILWVCIFLTLIIRRHIKRATCSGSSG